MELPLALDDVQDRQMLPFADFAAFDAPVVRYVELTPGRVVDIGFLAILDLAQVKPPIAVEIDGYTVARHRDGRLAAGSQEKDQTAQHGDSCVIHVSAFQIAANPGVGNRDIIGRRPAIRKWLENHGNRHLLDRARGPAYSRACAV